MYNLTNLRQSSIRVIRARSRDALVPRLVSGRITSIHRVRRPLEERVNVSLAWGFELLEGNLLNLLMPLYGLNDSGDCWYRTMTNHMNNDLGINTTARDISLLLKFVNWTLIRLSGTSVDGVLHARGDTFLKDCDLTLQKFESYRRETDRFTFEKLRVQTKIDATLIHQAVMPVR